MIINQRINRIVGQLHGIEKMVEKKRECSEVLQQISAVKKAIDGLSKEIVVSDFCKYVPKKNVKKMEKMVNQTIDL
jgi:CsoR family transcriptional regulator, copper-sensing transcriptional repressor